MDIKLNSLRQPSFFNIFIYIFTGILLWAVTFVGDYVSWGTSFSDISFSSPVPAQQMWFNLLSFFLTILNSILISYFVNRFNLTDTRTFFPFFIFFFLIIAWSPSHDVYYSHICLTLFIGALFQFMNMYHNPDVAEKAFLGSLFIGVASLMLNELIFLIPVCWLGFIIFQNFSLRTLLASLLGALSPWLIYIAVCYFRNPDIIFTDIINYDFKWGFNLDELSIGSMIYIGVIGFILICTIISVYAGFRTSAVSVRKSFNFVFILFIYFTFISFLQQQQSPVLLPFIALCYTLIASQAFAGKKTIFFNILFFTFCVSNLLYIAYNFIA